jgi:hypothetical protein
VKSRDEVRSEKLEARVQSKPKGKSQKAEAKTGDSDGPEIRDQIPEGRNHPDTV